MNVSDFEALFAKIENAVDAHPLLRRLTENPVYTAPSFKVTRLGFEADIHVKLKGSRKRASEICGHGDTAEEAAEKLIASLDHWAEAIK